MRKYLLFFGIAAAITIVAGLVGNHYNKYQTYKNNTEEAAAQAEADALKQAETKFGIEREELVGLYNGLRVECEKGAAAYEKHTTFSKTTLEKPECGLVLIR